MNKKLELTDEQIEILKESLQKAITGFAIDCFRNEVEVGIENPSINSELVKKARVAEDLLFDLKQVMTFSEASTRWGLSDSTLRKRLANNDLEEGYDCRKSAGTWLITEDAMIRMYGNPKK